MKSAPIGAWEVKLEIITDQVAFVGFFAVSAMQPDRK